MKKIKEWLENLEPAHWIGLVSGAIIVISIIIIIIQSMELGKMGTYIEGDYSEHSCDVCRISDKDVPADGGLYYRDKHSKDYYCKEHFAKRKALNENYDADSKKEVKCKSCSRSFKNTSSNASSIKRTGMCNNCYNNYSWGQEAVGNW